MLYAVNMSALLFFSARLFSCRVQVPRPKEGAALRREAEAAGAREVSQREDGQGARGCGRRRGRRSPWRRGRAHRHGTLHHAGEERPTQSTWPGALGTACGASGQSARCAWGRSSRGSIAPPFRRRGQGGVVALHASIPGKPGACDARRPPGSRGPSWARNPGGGLDGKGGRCPELDDEGSAARILARWAGPPMSATGFGRGARYTGWIVWVNRWWNFKMHYLLLSFTSTQVLPWLPWPNWRPIARSEQRSRLSTRVMNANIIPDLSFCKAVVNVSQPTTLCSKSATNPASATTLARGTRAVTHERGVLHLPQTLNQKWSP